MSFYQLTHSQLLPLDIDTAWDFFSSPANLDAITPQQMKFYITSGYTKEDKMFPGMIITYKLTPFLGIPLRWMTEITHVKEKEYFVDEQRFGPFAMWHHLHRFTAVPGGTQMQDVVNYKLPLGIIGRLAHALFVRRQLKNIFEYRKKKLETLFGVI